MIKLIHKTSMQHGGKKGQSLVELALFFPVLLMMLSGLVEFGFLLNQYINLMDGPREAARFATDFTPYEPDGSGGTRDVVNFYTSLATIAQQSIVPYNLDPALDDVIISVFGIKNNTVFRRFPADLAATSPSLVGQYRLYGNQTSRFTDAMINSRLKAGAPNTGLVLVELFYNYHQELNLPWLSPFVPNPILVSSYAITPLPAAEPK